MFSQLIHVGRRSVQFVKSFFEVEYAFAFDWKQH
jgi:hypothetical protein